MPRKIYRIEHEADGKGPYQHDVYANNRFTDTWPKRPGPSNDPGLSGKTLPANARFGFTSKAALGRWFNKGRRKSLAPHGFKLAIYEAEEVVASKLQAVFNADKARLIEKRELSNVQG